MEEVYRDVPRNIKLLYTINRHSGLLLSRLFKNISVGDASMKFGKKCHWAQFNKKKQ